MMNKIKSTDPKSSKIIDILKNFISTESTQNINSCNNDIRALVNSPLASETSPIFNKSSKVNVMSLKTVNISEMDSESQQNISTDCGTTEYTTKTDLESLFSRMVNSEMSEEITDKSGNTKNEFSVFSEYIKHENNAKRKRESESKGKVENLHGRNSQAQESGKSNFPEVKFCKNCSIPYINTHCCMHKNRDIIVDTTKKTSTSDTYENNSNSLISISKPQICSDSDSKITQDVDSDLSEIDVLKISTVPQDNMSSCSSLMQTNTVVVSKVINIQNPNYEENAKNLSACVTEGGKVMVSYNCLLEGNTFDSSTVRTNTVENDSKKYLCPYCSKCFGFRFTLERHILSHSILNPFQIHNSGVEPELIEVTPDIAEFSNDSLSCVIEEGKETNSSNCLLEGNTFDSSTVCTNTVENDSKKYLCPYCSKCFGFRFTLERHILSHSILNPFQIHNSGVEPELIEVTPDIAEFSNDSLSCVIEEGKETNSSNCLFKEKPLNRSCSKLKETVGSRHFCHLCLKCFRFRSTLERHVLSHNITKNALKGRNSVVVSEIICKENPDSRQSSKTFGSSINEEGKKMKKINWLSEEIPLNSDKRRPNSKDNYQRYRNKHVCPHCSKCFIFSATLERHIRSHNIHKYAFQKRYSKIVPKTSGTEIPDSGEITNSSLPHVINGNGSFNCLLETNTLDSDAAHPNLKQHDRNKHVCPSCAKCFRFRSSLERHIHSHNILVNGLQVGKRNKYLASGSFIKERPVILKTILRLRKKTPVQKCPHCSRTFEYPSKLGPHFKVLDHPSYTCHLCLITFSEQYKFLAHIQIVHQKRQQYFCDLCSKIFSKISYFRRHVQIHIRGKPFFCKDCAHSYSSSKELSFHICNYEKSQHQCVVCGKFFQKKSILIQHYLIHSNERPYPCNLCDYRAKQRYLLKIHIRSNHKLCFSE